MPKTTPNPNPTKKTPRSSTTHGGKKQAVSVKAIEKNGEMDVAKSIDGREILYPQPDSRIYRVGSKLGPLTVLIARKILGWETETEYRIRQAAKLSGVKPEEIDVSNVDWILTDESGDRVVCWNNIRNRPLDEGTVKKYVQDILNREWKLNGEAIIIGATGILISGQHRLIALVIAEQIRNGVDKEHDQSAHWQQVWGDEELHIETYTSLGIEESQKIIQTIDNVKTRTVSDSLYTSDMFKGMEPSKKKKHCKYMEKALDFLWTRIGGKDAFNQKQTHSALRDFSDRHPSILKAVLKVGADCNNDNQLVDVGLSPGLSAGCIYLMAAGRDDYNEYHNMEPKREEGLTLVLWNRAEDFWVELANKKDDVTAVRKALSMLVDPDNEGSSGRVTEKLCVLAKAWDSYQEGRAVTPSEVDLEDDYVMNQDGVNVLENRTDFGGIDVGFPKIKVKTAPDTASLEKAAQEERQRRNEEIKRKLLENREKMKKAPPQTA